MIAKGVAMLPQAVNACRNDADWPFPTVMMIYSPPTALCPLAAGTYDGVCATNRCSAWMSTSSTDDMQGTCGLLPSTGKRDAS